MELYEHGGVYYGLPAHSHVPHHVEWIRRRQSADAEISVRVYIGY